MRGGPFIPSGPLFPQRSRGWHAGLRQRYPLFLQESSLWHRIIKARRKPAEEKERARSLGLASYIETVKAKGIKNLSLVPYPTGKLVNDELVKTYVFLLGLFR